MAWIIRDCLSLEQNAQKCHLAARPIAEILKEITHRKLTDWVLIGPDETSCWELWQAKSALGSVICNPTWLWNDVKVQNVHFWQLCSHVAVQQGRDLQGSCLNTGIWCHLRSSWGTLPCLISASRKSQMSSSHPSGGTSGSWGEPILAGWSSLLRWQVACASCGESVCTETGVVNYWQNRRGQVQASLCHLLSLSDIPLAVPRTSVLPSPSPSPPAISQGSVNPASGPRLDGGNRGEAPFEKEQTHKVTVLFTVSCTLLKAQVVFIQSSLLELQDG